jgi:hypothetical protein
VNTPGTLRTFVAEPTRVYSSAGTTLLAAAGSTGANYFQHSHQQQQPHSAKLDTSFQQQQEQQPQPSGILIAQHPTA